jgi:hypothetical protein
VERAVILNPNGKFILRAVVKGTATAPPPGVGLGPPGHGADGGMVFTINGGDSYCVTLGGAAGGLARDAPLNLGFRIRRAASETGCPMPATTTSTSTCTTTTSTDTTTTT